MLDTQDASKTSSTYTIFQQQNTSQYPRLLSGAEQAAVSRLPVELLGHIFLQCQFDDDVGPIQLEAVRLGWVCSTWRQVAVSTPLLWRTIRILKGAEMALGELSEHDKMKLRTRQWNLLDVLLQRSGDILLDIHVVSLSNSATFEYDTTMYDSLWRTLAGKAHRWRSLNMATDFDDFEVLNTVIRNGLPELQHLKISVEENNSSDDDPALTLFGVLPKLESLTSHSDNFDLFDLPPAVPRLHIFTNLPADAFQDFGQLTHLHLVAIHPLLVRPHQEPRVSHTLTHLTLEDVPCYNRSNARSLVDTAFRVLTFPALTSLKILSSNVHGRRGPPGSNFDGARSFIQRSYCALRELSIEIPLHTVQDLVIFLQTTPTVKTFSLLEPAHYTTGLGRRPPAIIGDLVHELELSASGHDTPFLPRLTDLTLAIARGRQVQLDLDALERMIQSRWRCGREMCEPLRKVSITVPNLDLVGELKHRLEPLRMGGLHLNVQRSPFWPDLHDTVSMNGIEYLTPNT